jgi:D-serine deaminase-like pyridoxal phosphate-dependent protein
LINRRRFLTGTAGLTAAALAGGWLLRPGAAASGGHTAYFEGLSQVLRERGLARPTMLLDLDLIDRNIEAVEAGNRARDYRIVAKSLPSEPLLDYVMKRAETDRLMVFHQSFLNEVAARHETADVLLGKPMPALAAERFYEAHETNGFDPARQIQWLVDTPERLRQYAELARARGVAMRLNFEIDVGLHRGGFTDPAEVARAIQVVGDDANLSFAGFMGYDPHVAVVPTVLGARDAEFARVQRRYSSFLEAARETTGEAGDTWTLNAAGSPTYRLWDDVEGLANEVAAGSALVKPLHFEVDTLEDHVPALFIATPVLKTSDGMQIPALDGLGRLQQLWNPNRARTFFIYGGYWKAEPVSPPGLATNPLFGHSTNQEMLTGPADVELEVDDYVFLRPTQSEFVMLQFGDLLAVRGSEFVGAWEPLPEGG